VSGRCKQRGRAGKGGRRYGDRFAWVGVVDIHETSEGVGGNESKAEEGHKWYLNFMDIFLIGFVATSAVDGEALCIRIV
jgi:hypothetical protein